MTIKLIDRVTFIAKDRDLITSYVTLTMEMDLLASKTKKPESLNGAKNLLSAGTKVAQLYPRYSQLVQSHAMVSLAVTDLVQVLWYQGTATQLFEEIQSVIAWMKAGNFEVPPP